MVQDIEGVFENAYLKFTEKVIAILVNYKQRRIFHFIYERKKLNDQGETVKWTQGISTEDLIDLKNDLTSERPH